MMHLKALFSLILLFSFSVSAQHLKQEESQYLNENIISLSSTPDFGQIDWSFIDKDIKDKRIIAIGEFNHGAKEVFEIRNSLVAYLHENHGFDIILFESGMGEILLPNEKKKLISPEKMTKGFFGIWQTQAFADLMSYIQKEEIEMAAFDVQRSARHFEQYLNAYLGSSQIDPQMYKHLESRFGSLQNRFSKESYDTLYHETTDLIQDYTELKDQFYREFDDSLSTELKLCKQVIQNRIAYLKYFLAFSKTKDWHERFTARDSIMADNVIWLSEELYPNQKLIVVAHNYHISKFNEVEETMGETLANHFGDQYFTIGSYGLSGSYAGNNGKAKKIEPADSTNTDIKHFVANQNGYSHYLSLPKNPTSNCQFLFKPVIINDSFLNLKKGNTLVPAKHFDALILIQEVKVPVFLKG